MTVSVVERVARLHQLDLRDELLCARVLDFGLVELAQREYEMAKQVEEAERAKFELGDSTLLSVNLREQATFDAALRRIDSLVEYHRARVSYQAILGTDAP